MLSRRNTRLALLQALYADIFIHHLDISLFRESYDDENPLSHLDEDYFSTLRESIHIHHRFLIGIIVALAPKFDIEKMPKIHIIILMIALAEMLFWRKDDIDAKVSMNEAIELAKRFSDESGKKFINGALSTFQKNRESFANVSEKDILFFAQ